MSWKSSRRRLEAEASEWVSVPGCKVGTDKMIPAFKDEGGKQTETGRDCLLLTSTSRGRKAREGQVTEGQSATLGGLPQPVGSGAEGRH